MPTYDYECSACKHAFELFQSITAAPEKKCPKCGKKKLVRLIGAGAGLIFKGSGFYITDYKHDTKEYKSSAEGDKKVDSGKKAAEKVKGASEKPSGEKPSGEKPAAGEKAKGKD
jgi:putative FmdB family regulatory protein